jgi:hypothetical protein
VTPPTSQILPTPSDTSRSRYRIVSGDNPDVLARIAEPAVGLALWRRQLPETLTAWLGDLPMGRLPAGHVLARLDDLAEAVASLFAASRTPRHTNCDVLAADMIDLAARFAHRATSDIVDLRLETVRHDACWKFHCDCVRLRLLTTYLGPSTQIVAASQAARALRLQRDYDGPYRRIPEHAIALFKGEQAERGTGVVHRSPPIDGTGQHRLVLTINLPSLASPESWKATAS